MPQSTKLSDCTPQLDSVTLCSEHKICQRFKCKVDEAFAHEQASGANAGGASPPTKNTESMGFEALYNEFWEKRKSDDYSYFDVATQHDTIVLVFDLLKAILETEPWKRSKVYADISIKFVNYLENQRLTSVTICPKVILKQIRSFVGATRRGLRGADDPQHISAVKFSDLTQKNKVLLYWVRFLSS